MVSSAFVATVGALALAPFASAFDAQAKTNVAVYYVRPYSTGLVTLR